MITKGYKYILWNMVTQNADIYVGKAESGEPLSYNELKNARGYYDQTEMQGIYFCKTIEDMFIWLKEECEWDNHMDGIELLEITPLNEVKEKIYDYYDGRSAYVTETCKVRILKEEEIPDYINKFLDDYFEKM